MPRRKWQKGPRIASLAALVELILAGRMVYLNHKVYHPGFVRGMTLHTLDLFVRREGAFLAEPITENTDV